MKYTREQLNNMSKEELVAALEDADITMELQQAIIGRLKPTASDIVKTGVTCGMALAGLILAAYNLKSRYFD